MASFSCGPLRKTRCFVIGQFRPKVITGLIINITISSLVIGLKKSYFPLIRLPSCYRTVFYWIVCYWRVCYWTVQEANHIQRCSLNQPVTFKVVITCVRARCCFCFCPWPLEMFTLPLPLFYCEFSPFFITSLFYFFSEIVIFMINSNNNNNNNNNNK